MIVRIKNTNQLIVRIEQTNQLIVRIEQPNQLIVRKEKTNQLIVRIEKTPSFTDRWNWKKIKNLKLKKPFLDFKWQKSAGFDLGLISDQERTGSDQSNQKIPLLSKQTSEMNIYEPGEGKGLNPTLHNASCTLFPHISFSQAQLHYRFCILRIWVFATNSNFLIPISL